MIRIVFLGIGMWLAGSAAPAADVTAVLSTNRITVGDRVLLTLRVEHREQERIVVPNPQREPVIMVWDMESTGESIRDGRRQTTTRIALSSFVVGEHRIATNALIVLAEGGSETSLPFPELVLRVDSVLTNPPPALADIKPPAAFPGRIWPRVLAMIAGIAALALIAAWLLRNGLKRKKTSAPVTRRVPPHEVALAALKALLQRGWMESGDAEPFYVELSAIVRLYLEERFDLKAPEQTTEEFIRTSSQSNQLSSDHRTLTQAFLEQSDLVKFARFQPEIEDMRNAWDAAARLVRETIPAPQPPGPGGAR
ncbi:MAG TPA: hypothetical protein PKE26_05835 [Kiritimatiellia bacterium]|nr:hypothetical protein [Kiritimatiellia bacterium]HMO98614.1 hypothetical protein [Kiritimatiellia bacterium]HMP96358.1 hypothetical protein [Kiritimatiellia bacterium]